MSAYIIVDIDVTDPAGYAEYTRLVPATLEAYGGTYLARGGATTVLEGDWTPKRLVIVRFENAERAKAWWASQEYAPAKAIRYANSTGNMVLVEGL